MDRQTRQSHARENGVMAGAVKKTNAAREKKLEEKALQICESSRAQLILKYPFVGRLGIQIPFVPVNDSRIHTIATNGKVIYFRPGWVCSMPPVSMTATVAHTIWTAALCHSFRRGESLPERFDLASDIEVYKLLQVEKVNMARKPEFAYLFNKHLPVEEIYGKLPQKIIRRHPDSDVHLYTAGVISLPELPGETQAKKVEDECKTPGNMPGEGSESRDDAGKGHTHGTLCEKEQSSPQNEDKGTPEEEHIEADCSCDPGMREVWRQRIIEAGQHYKMIYGDLPGEFADLVAFFSKSKINYLQLLRRYLGQCSGGESRWIPPARRFIWQGEYLPSRQNPVLEIVTAVDTSGSIEKEDFQRFFGEIASIVQSFPNYRLTLIQCDTVVTDVQRYSRERPFKSIQPLQIKGGGGTDFKPVFEYLKKEKITPKVLIYYTDGEGALPPKAPPYPVLWMLSQEQNMPWGKKIVISEN